MKRKIAILILFLFAGFAYANAQGGGGFQRRTVEERVKTVHEKIDSAFKLEAKNMAEVDSIFSNYYKSQDKVREDMMAGGGQVDRQAMMEKMQPLMDDRDAKLKKALGDDKFKTWKEQIEPTMRRPGGGGGRGNNR
jgi:protein CpxP